MTLHYCWMRKVKHKSCAQPEDTGVSVSQYQTCLIVGWAAYIKNIGFHEIVTIATFYSGLLFNSTSFCFKLVYSRSLPIFVSVWLWKVNIHQVSCLWDIFFPSVLCISCRMIALFSPLTPSPTYSCALITDISSRCWSCNSQSLCSHFKTA